RHRADRAVFVERLNEGLDRFHRYRDIFIETGVRVDISLPRQHALVHYIRSIQLFGSPNGLCSSITESKHIKAVKEPWRRSSHFNALPQMLVTLCRLDKMAASFRAFWARGMLVGTASSYTAMVLNGGQPQIIAAAAIAGDDDDDQDTAVPGPKSLSSIELAVTPQRGYPHELLALAVHITQPRFPLLFRRYLYEHVHGPILDDTDIPEADYPAFAGKISVRHGGIARFYAPSDLCGAGGMYREIFRSNPNWHGYARRDTVLIDVGAPAMGGLVIGRVLLLFSFTYGNVEHQCALVRWLVPVGDTPDPDTGMWVVEPEVERRQPSLAIIKMDCIARAAHLLPVYGSAPLPEDFHFSYSLDAFNRYFVN
ncbi:hypothetical protein C8J57DRAFT_1019271, partial [Mycena rebaudengoi]